MDARNNINDEYKKSLDPLYEFWDIEFWDIEFEVGDEDAREKDK